LRTGGPQCLDELSELVGGSGPTRAYDLAFDLLND